MLPRRFFHWTRSEGDGNAGAPAPSSRTRYRRVDLDALMRIEAAREGVAPPTDAATAFRLAGSEAREARNADADAVASEARNVRWFILPLAVVLSLAQAISWVYLSNTRTSVTGASLISVMGIAVVFVAALAVNPVLRFLRRFVPVSPLRRAELVTVFAAMSITTGVSTFGLVDQFIPLIVAPYNADWSTRQRGWTETIHAGLNPHLFIKDPAVIAEFRQGILREPPESAPWMAHARFYRDVALNIPWRHWLGPIACWLLFAAAWYALFYSLTAVALPFWSRREKLIFPLARLPEQLLPDAQPGASILPATLRSGLFWCAFAFSFLILSYNASVEAQWITGVKRIPLGISSWQLVEYFEGSFLDKTDYWFAFLFLFTTIGLAFLLPAEMSFSVWFYFVLSRVAMVMLKFAGVTGDPRDYRGGVLGKSDPFCAQAGGGLMVFAAIGLTRCVMEFHTLSAGKPWRQRLRIAWPLLALAGSFVALSAWFTWCDLPWYWSAALVAVSTLLAIGLMRLVADAGIHWFQVQTGFFHVHRMFGLSGVLSSSVLAPILPLYAVIFSDAKCLLAPALASAADLRRASGVSRWRFHLTVVSSLVVSVVGSTFYVLVLGYSRGANRMMNWFYNQNPNRTLDAARDMVLKPASFEPANAVMFVVGGVWIAFTMYLRRTLFWVPHPVGYIALMSPLMEQLWLSFLIAWALKKLVVRYGSKRLYEQARAAAIGLVVGELVAVAFWAIVALCTGGVFNSASINRYG